MNRIDVIGQNGGDGLHYSITEEDDGVSYSLGSSYADKIDFMNKTVEGREDVVNEPNHYKLFPDMEVRDVIHKALTPEEWIGYCKGNVLKYRLRAGKKDDLEQDIGKADVYRSWL